MFVDFQNLFNQDITTSVVTRYPSTTVSYFDANNVQKSKVVQMGYPTGIQGARQITFGGRWSF